MISESNFNKLAKQGYNRIPLMCEILADLDTPLSTYTKICNLKYSYLFESVEGGDKWGRYSIIGLPAKKIISVCGNKITIEENNKCIDEYNTNDPLAEIEKIQQSYKVPQIENMPRFNGGLVGYFGYETIKYIEPKLNKNEKEDPIGSPDILLMVSDEVIIFDNLSGKLFIIVHAEPEKNNAYSDAKKRLNTISEILSSNQVKKTQLNISRDVNEKDFVSGFTQKYYEKPRGKVDDTPTRAKPTPARRVAPAPQPKPQPIPPSSQTRAPRQAKPKVTPKKGIDAALDGIE